MFENIGGKIKKLARVWLWLGLIGFFGLAMIMFISSSDAYGAEEDFYSTLGYIFLLGGPIYTYMSSLLIYGFGQLIENSDNIIKQSEK
ncbi:MAG: hypothetical protein IJZ57_04510 [Clostridia bacterium]|nr:hypothetical protein [Clostridia bacterium]